MRRCCASNAAVAALLEDGTVETWGVAGGGGESRRWDLEKVFIKTLNFLDFNLNSLNDSIGQQSLIYAGGVGR